MPLFRSKFQPKKSPARKATTVSNLRRNLDALLLEKEFGIQVDTIKLDLDGNQQQLQFNIEEGKWKSCGPVIIKTKSPSLSLRKSEEDKTRENFLKVQVQVLLDMLTETTLEAHLKASGISTEEPTLKQKKSFKGCKLF